MIAWTWLHYVEDPTEPDWLARLPMTKASIKAIDAIQGFLGDLIHQGSKLTVPSRFITSGGSKRGWTSWMTGCVDDPRVIAVIPVVAVCFFSSFFSSFFSFFPLIDFLLLNKANSSFGSS